MAPREPAGGAPRARVRGAERTGAGRKGGRGVGMGKGAESRRLTRRTAREQQLLPRTVRPCIDAVRCAGHSVKIGRGAGMIRDAQMVSGRGSV